MELVAKQCPTCRNFIYCDKDEDTTCQACNATIPGSTPVGIPDKNHPITAWRAEMVCRSCGSSDIIVTDRRTGMDGYINRFRECRNCSATWVTVERPGPGVGSAHDRTDPAMRKDPAAALVLTHSEAQSVLSMMEWAHDQVCPRPDWCDANHPILKGRHDMMRKIIAKFAGRTD